MIKFCSLYSGSSGNCVFVSSGNTRLLVDAGVSGTRIVSAIHDIGEKPCDIDALLVTHEHSDHISAAGIMSRRFDLPIYATSKTWESMEAGLGNIKPHNIKTIDKDNSFEIGDIGIKAFSVPHDAADPVAYSFFIGNCKVTTATDIGHITDDITDNLKGSAAILLESNHNVNMLKMGRYPWPLKQRILGDKGHLSNEVCAKLAAMLVKLGTTRIILGHLSQENNSPELAYITTYNEFVSNDISVGEDVKLAVASRTGVSEVCNL